MRAVHLQAVHCLHSRASLCVCVCVCVYVCVCVCVGVGVGVGAMTMIKMLKIPTGKYQERMPECNEAPDPICT